MPVVRIRFGECVLDTAARVLTRAGGGVTLSPRAFDLLVILLERRPQLVTQAELRDRLWPRTFVAYSSLARVVTEVRTAIADRRRRLVRTVYGRGYAFSGDAIDEMSGCSLLWEGRLVPLIEGENVVGRGDECHVRVRSAKVSRRHARIVVAGGRATIEDLGSKNGTFVGTRPVEGARLLSEGDEILVGAAVLRFRGPAGPGSTETA